MRTAAPAADEVVGRRSARGRQRGKTRRVGKSVGRRNHWKKAIVTLREGETIEQIFEG